MAKANFVLKRKLKNDEYGIYIRVQHLNQPAKYLKLPLKSKLNQWNKKKQRFRKNKLNYKKLNQELSEIENNVESIISELLLSDQFSYDAFRKTFLKSDSTTVNDFFIEKLKQLKLTNRHGSYRAYNNCYSSLQKFTSLDFNFLSLDFKFLTSFETFHIKLGNKPNTCGAYFRALRALHYEYCKLNDIVEPGIYRRFNIARLKNEARKKSLTKEQMKKFINYQPASEAQTKAKLLFLFSFYARGINLMDMLQLTNKNTEDDILFYRRQKTGKEMRISLTMEAIKILNYFKNDTKFLFPYLRKGDIPKFRITDVNRNINRRLNLISKAIDIGDISLGCARHTFAELHYKAGIRIEIISQMLGHSDLRTTQIYLRSFSDDEVDNAASKVFDSLL